MSESKLIVLIGAGGVSAEIIEAAELSGWTVSQLYDDNPALLGRELLGGRCIGSINDFAQSAPARYILAIGNNDVREQVGQRLAQAGHIAQTIVHQSAVVSGCAEVGRGVYIGAGAFIGPWAAIGDHAIVNVAASVGHDASIGACAQLCPGVRISGGARVGAGAFIGSNAVVAPRVIMGDWARLGAASFAARAVPAGKLAVGVPARLVEE